MPLLIAILLLFVVAATALYGPQAAALVEMFPTRIRYTAMSLPYHVGTGWVGGFLPVTSFAIVALTGDIYAGLWYAVGFTALSAVVTIFFLKETARQAAGGVLSALASAKAVAPVRLLSKDCRHVLATWKQQCLSTRNFDLASSCRQLPSAQLPLWS